MSRRLPTRSQRGVALLLVVATLALLLPAAAWAATVAMHRRTALDRHASEQMAAEILLASDACIRGWLHGTSPTVVLPPDADVPSIGVADDVLLVGEGTIAVRITAWDQRGLVPVELTVPGSPLGRRFPPDIRARLDEGRVRGAAADLDGLAAPVGIRPHAVRTYPRAVSGDHARQASTPDAIGDHVGFAPPPHRINVATAPREVLEPVMRRLGRGGLGRILDARERGLLPSIGGDGRPRNHRRGDAAGDDLQLVNRSDAWSFRIDIVVDEWAWSWWAAYRLDDRRQWRLEHRSVIAE